MSNKKQKSTNKHEKVDTKIDDNKLAVCSDPIISGNSIERPCRSDDNTEKKNEKKLA